MRACEALSYEPAAAWQRLQQAKHEFFFEDLDQLMKQRHHQFLEELMSYERQCFLNVQPYQRSEQRVDQANGFYRRRLTTRVGVLELAVPRTRSGHFHPQVLARYQRREPVVNEALKQSLPAGRVHAPDRSRLGEAGGRRRQRFDCQRGGPGAGCLSVELSSPPAFLITTAILSWTG
jgi:mutator family transposase